MSLLLIGVTFLALFNLNTPSITPDSNNTTNEQTNEEPEETEEPNPIDEEPEPSFLEVQYSSYLWEQLNWSDEFNYSGFPNESKWNFEWRGPGWVNEEEQEYVKDLNNSYVEDGTLIIKAVLSDKIGIKYTSARINTQSKAYWTYGRFEARAILPHGRGLWPAIWMMPQSSVYGGWPESGEIDIMEYVGYQPGLIHGTIHCDAYNHLKGTQQGGSVFMATCEEQFHIYAIEWFPNRIDFFVDDIKYFTFQKEVNASAYTWPFDQNFYWILNIAVGGTWGGLYGIDDSVFPQTMIVDYIRVYQNSTYS
ncbi:MAG: glycoside hydrolase family 16 protein [Promethearchaeota archaeon]